MLNHDSEAEFFDRLSRIRTFGSNGQKALHKPILLLYALSRLKHSDAHTIRYVDADTLISPLLKQFGPPGTRARVSDPFTRLEHDGIWQIKFTERHLLFNASGSGKPGVLYKFNVEAGFEPRCLSFLLGNPTRMDTSVSIIVREHILPRIVAEVLDAVGWST